MWWTEAVGRYEGTTPRDRHERTTPRVRQRGEPSAAHGRLEELVSREILAELTDPAVARSTLTYQQRVFEESEHDVSMARRKAEVERAGERALATATISKLEADLANVLHESAEGAKACSAAMARATRLDEELATARHIAMEREQRSLKLEAALSDALEEVGLRDSALEASKEKIEELRGMVDQWQTLATRATQEAEATSAECEKLRACFPGALNEEEEALRGNGEGSAGQPRAAWARLTRPQSPPTEDAAQSGHEQPSLDEPERQLATQPQAAVVARLQQAEAEVIRLRRDLEEARRMGHMRADAEAQAVQQAQGARQAAAAEEVRLSSENGVAVRVLEEALRALERESLAASERGRAQLSRARAQLDELRAEATAARADAHVRVAEIEAAGAAEREAAAAERQAAAAGSLDLRCEIASLREAAGRHEAERARWEEERGRRDVQLEEERGKSKEQQGAMNAQLLALKDALVASGRAVDGLRAAEEWSAALHAMALAEHAVEAEAMKHEWALECDEWREARAQGEARSAAVEAERRRQCSELAAEYESRLASATLQNAWRRIGTSLAAAQSARSVEASHRRHRAELTAAHEAREAELARQAKADALPLL